MHFDRPSDLLLWSLRQDLGSEDLNQTLRHYYTSFRRNFGPLRRSKYDEQLAWLTAEVRRGAIRTVLDVGCGCGTVSLWLAQQGAEVYGIDLKDDRLAVAQRRAEMLAAPVRFANQSLFDVQGQFDAVWLEQAFHHVEPRAEAFAHIARLLSPGGRVVISDSNAWNPLNHAIAIKARGFKSIKQKVDAEGRVHLYGDERITTPGALAKGFRRHGVQQIERRYFGVLPNNRAAEKMGAVERLIPAFMVPAFTHYLWVGQKA